MPIAQPAPVIVSTPNAPTTTIPLIPQVNDGAFLGVAVDTRYTPQASLITNIEGANWTVSYYNQIIDQSNGLAPQSTDRVAAYQQYLLIQGLELKVLTALQTSQNDETKNISMSGSALVYPGIIPNDGDMIVADSGDGRTAMFTVKSTEKKSFLKDTVYQIDYVIVDYTTPEIINDLQSKVIQTAVFVKGNLSIGRNSIVASNQYTAMQNCQLALKRLFNQYMANFFSNEFQTLLVPDQGISCYDPFLVHAILDWFTTDDHPFMKKIKPWNVDGDLMMKSFSLWEVFNSMDIALLPTAFQQAGAAGTGWFSRYPYYNGIFFSGIGDVVYPLDQRTDVDAGYIPVYVPAMDVLTEGTQPFKELKKLISLSNINGFSYQVVGANTLPDIVPVTIDQYYVFSQGFYANPGIPASTLEQLALQALQGQSLNTDNLLRLASNSLMWGTLERFYYIPILLALLKVTIGVN